VRVGSSRFAAQAIAVAAVYAGAARLGLLVAPVGGFASLVWPPTGIALAVLVAGGYRFWPSIALGAFVANVWARAPAEVAAGIAAGNTLEALLGAYLLRRFGGVGRSLDGLRQVLALVVLGAVVSTTVSATLGVASLAVGEVISRAEVAETWRAWWVGDALGALIVAPLLLAWSAPPHDRRAGRRRIEAVALAASLAAASALVFGHSPTSEAHGFLAPYLLMPFLLWAVIRFSMQGATAAIFLVSTIAVLGTALGRGPFAEGSLSRGLLLLQLFMAVTATTVLVLGAVIAERADAIRRREELVAIVSHDLRSPLSVIRMATRALVKLLDEGGAADQPVAHAASVIDRSVERMNLLIRDLLDLAALQDGFLVLERKPHDAGALAGETAELMRPLAAEKSQTLSLEVPEAPVGVVCDRERLVQALSNLVGNALKFTPAGGAVTLSVERLEGEVSFTVADNGPGIPRDELPHVFERFWRTRQAGAAHAAGLGLSIVKGLAEAHGGSVTVESRVGAGSAFCLRLPTADRGPGERTSAAASGARWGSLLNGSER
jgi:signal transduction histidine kinase